MLSRTPLYLPLSRTSPRGAGASPTGGAAPPLQPALRRPRDATLVRTWDLDTDRGVSQLLAFNGRQLVVVPTNKGGLTAALWLRREVSRLGVLDVPLLVGDTANLCAHVKVPCAYTVQCTESRGSFARVL